MLSRYLDIGKRSHNFSKLAANGLQFFVNQFSAILLFFVSSKYLSKELFGYFNWLTACYVTLGALISFGIEQVLIAQVAKSQSVKMTRLYLCHLLLFSSLALLLCAMYVIAFESGKPLLVYILFGLWMLMSLVSSAFKNSLTGLEQFVKLSKISLISGFIKLSGVALFIMLPYKSIETILLILITGLVSEAITGYWSVSRLSDWPIVRADFKKNHRALLKIAFPQFIVTIFSLALARFDWIYIGLTQSSGVTADYTFAYKMFEFAKIPLLVISPILLPLFTRMVHSEGSKKDYASNLKQLYRAELFLAGLVPIFFAALWDPVLQHVFNNKYGPSNFLVFSTLCLAVPLQYAADYYWNLVFAKGQYRLSMWVAVITGLVDIVLVLILTPLYGGLGAAIAYAISAVIPVAIYHIAGSEPAYRIDLKRLLLVAALIIASLLIIYGTHHNLLVGLSLSLAYAVLLPAFKFLDLRKLISMFFN